MFESLTLPAPMMVTFTVAPKSPSTMTVTAPPTLRVVRIVSGSSDGYKTSSVVQKRYGFAFKFVFISPFFSHIN